METISVSLNDTLKQLRAELAREFPGVKFSVRRSRGTAYGYVDVSWTDGPTTRDVDAITAMYEGSRFGTDQHGNQDIEYRVDHIGADAQGNPVRILHSTRGISTSRVTTPAIVQPIVEQLAAMWRMDAPEVVASSWNGGAEIRATPTQDAECMKRTGKWWQEFVWRYRSEQNI